MTPIARLRVASERVRAVAAAVEPSGVRHDDADDVIGTLATDDAIGFDPFPMLDLMQRSGANFAVFGQVAGILHGSVELTGDLDLLWDGAGTSVEMLARELERSSVAIRDEDGELQQDVRGALKGRKVYFEGVGCAGDLCTPRLPWRSLDVVGILERKVSTTEGGLTVPYVALGDLIAMRRAVDRPKDHRRAAELQQVAAR